MTAFLRTSSLGCFSSSVTVGRTALMSSVDSSLHVAESAQHTAAGIRPSADGLTSQNMPRIIILGTCTLARGAVYPDRYGSRRNMPIYANPLGQVTSKQIRLHVCRSACSQPTYEVVVGLQIPLDGVDHQDDEVAAVVQELGACKVRHLHCIHRSLPSFGLCSQSNR